MAFTETYLPNSRSKFFQFFATGNTTMVEALNLGKAFELADIRLILSAAHPSVTYFTANLSAGQGSAYNVVLASFLASTLTNVTDRVWTPSADKILYQHNDTIQFSMLNSVGAVWGLVVTGWAVQD